MSIGKQLTTFTKGAVIFRQGDIGECAYLVEHGRIQVSILKDEIEIPIRTIGKGEVFGEMSLIDNSPRSATCRAVSDTRLIVVTKEQLLNRVQSADPVVQLLMRALVERLRSNNNPNHISPSSKQDPAEQEAIRQIELENKIVDGLDKNQFVPFYQPIYDLKTGEMVGAEALIRWINADGSIVHPDSFMDIVEQSSLVIRAGEVMIEKCFADLNRIHQRPTLNQNFFVSINIGARHFSSPELLTTLEAQRAKFGIEATKVKLEVTERLMMEGPQALEILKKCREVGYHLAIDDFGTGFSCLQYLAAMPLTDLKIDRSFVSSMLSNEKSLVVVKALVQMARLLGIKLIAEGVETEEQLAVLRGLGIEMGQGFLFSKALPFEQLVALPARIQNVSHLKAA
jgi:EAL domain-containing protein (putative c-di-GMP-specific phosphodiesterase class I)